MPKGGKPKQQKKRAEKAAQQKSKKAEREERKRRRKDRDRYTDDEDKRFAAQLAAAGLRVNEVDADGNCLFRALSDQIEGSAKHHGKYRDEIVAFMRRDEERFKWFVEDDEDWDDYLARIGRDGEWGGNLELVAAANLRSVNVVVHQLEAPKFEICADDNSATRTVHLSYPVWKSLCELGYIEQTLRRLKLSSTQVVPRRGALQLGAAKRRLQ